MDILSSLTILAGLLLYTSVSRRIENSLLTGPILFVSFGYVFGPDVLNFIRIDLSSDLVKTLAELTLVFVLFSDSSRINITELRAHSALPVRLLAFALPLTIVAGLGAALLLFGELSLWEAALIAIIVAPTDAALGQAVITSEHVPKAIRSALNVEAALMTASAFRPWIRASSRQSWQQGLRQTIHSPDFRRCWPRPWAWVY